jgi:hypothetical protein
VAQLPLLKGLDFSETAFLLILYGPKASKNVKLDIYGSEPLKHGYSRQTRVRSRFGRSRYELL